MSDLDLIYRDKGLGWDSRAKKKCSTNNPGSSKYKITTQKKTQKYDGSFHSWDFFCELPCLNSKKLSTLNIGSRIIFSQINGVASFGKI